MTLINIAQKVDYLFTVAGVDTGGSIGEPSASSEVVTLDGMLKFRKIV